MFRMRDATPADLEKLVAFTAAEAFEAEGAAFSIESVRRGVGAGLENPALARYWVLETDDGELVGNISIIREWSDWRAGYYWWIQSVYLSPEHRGRGLLTMMLNKVREEAAAAGALELRLYAHEGNRRALQAYRREGFADLPYRIMVLKELS